ncbi:MAG TPA: hypothetical protein VG165_08265 [Solirubrobacteraceae bacterium]|nr:hypothetical protein [Solirubrobacteraceae bacterium]
MTVNESSFQMRPGRINLTSAISLRAVVLAAALVAASAALAYFTTIGAGGASATVGSTQAITLSPGTPTTALYPGGHGDVAVTVDNPNPVSVLIGSLTLSTGQGAAGYAVDGSHASCSTTTLSFMTQTNGGAGWSVPPKVGSTDGSLSIALTSALAMSASAANTCQGATFSVYLTAGP